MIAGNKVWIGVNHRPVWLLIWETARTGSISALRLLTVAEHIPSIGYGESDEVDPHVCKVRHESALHTPISQNRKVWVGHPKLVDRRIPYIFKKFQYVISHLLLDFGLLLRFKWYEDHGTIIKLSGECVKSVAMQVANLKLKAIRQRPIADRQSQDRPIRFGTGIRARAQRYQCCQQDDLRTQEASFSHIWPRSPYNCQSSSHRKT